MRERSVATAALYGPESLQPVESRAVAAVVRPGPFPGTRARGLLLDAGREFLMAKIKEGWAEAPVIPHSLATALKLVRDPDASFDRLAEILAADASLASGLLRFANRYGMAARVTGVRNALVRIGMTGARAALMNASSRELVRVPGRERITDRLHARSRAVSSGACALVEILGGSHLPSPDEALTAGAMHDIGRTLIHSMLRRDRRALPRLISSSRLWDRLVEGLHAEIAWEASRHWGLAPEVVSALGLHHEPERATESVGLTRIVAASCAFADHLGIEPEGGCARPLEHPHVASLGMTPTQVRDVVERISMRTNRPAVVA